MYCLVVIVMNVIYYFAESMLLANQQVNLILKIVQFNANWKWATRLFQIYADNLQTIGLSSLVNLGTSFELYKVRISILQHLSQQVPLYMYYAFV